MTAPEFVSLGDAIWLDFVNTAGAPDGPVADRLADAAAYARWLRAQHLPDDDAESRFPAAQRLRARLVEIAEALAAGRPAPAGAVEALNVHLRDVPGHERLTRIGGTWQLGFAPVAPRSALAAIARSAAASLAAPVLGVRRCAGEGCGLFIADTSVSQGRAFCSAATCGRTRRVERRRRSLG